VGRHRIFYDFNGQDISVARVLHQAMVPEDWL
jgi:plasmid stabilization system protein ParE